MRGARLRPVVPADLPGVLQELGRPEGLVRLAAPTAGWARAAQEQWGLCGIQLVDDDRAVAAALVCSGLHLPGNHPLRRFRCSPDAALLLAVVVAPDAPAPQVLVRQLGQGLARHLDDQVVAVQGVGRREPGSCLECEAEWLAAAAFVAVEERPREGRQLMELQLDRGVRWHPDLQAAWQALAGLVPRPCPPSGAAGRRLGER